LLEDRKGKVLMEEGGRRKKTTLGNKRSDAIRGAAKSTPPAKVTLRRSRMHLTSLSIVIRKSISDLLHSSSIVRSSYFFQPISIIVVATSFFSTSVRLES
jgi:hypothetical protein